MDPLFTGNASNTNTSSQTISKHKNTNIFYLQSQATVEPLLEDTPHPSIMDTYWIPNITHIMYNEPLTRGHPLYNGQFLLGPMVSALERFHCSYSNHAMIKH